VEIGGSVLHFSTSNVILDIECHLLASQRNAHASHVMSCLEKCSSRVNKTMQKHLCILDFYYI